MIKNLFIFLFFIQLYQINSFAKGGKLIIVDNDLYDTIQILNVLDGGLKKKYKILSTKLSEETIKNFYPEYFLYSGEICYKINDIYINNNVQNSSKNFLYIQNQIEDEVKKVKLLQLLNDIRQEYSETNVNKNLLSAIGVVCKDKIIFRGKNFKTGDRINTMVITNIDYTNGLLHVQER